ncbi:hypothetical protein MLD38_032922 [Melastoma candidum]|uniref:Uncharacterized protein n=1 Tax=Melastoma candidum TaxID=119954 RepID=A0ACB9M766_9MYRT|nr:hypothetical protein MLD38_032922 [Melastoma candidum]
MAVQQAPAPAVAPTADVVGNAFVHQYYLVLHQSPEHVHRFYQDGSKLGRPGENGVMGITSTMQAINEKIMSLDYGEFRAEIISVDAQDSLNGGVIVLVTGYLTGGDNLRRKFTQSFFLAPQDKGYFVLNDIFRYLDECNDEDASNGTVYDVEAPFAPEAVVEEAAPSEEVEDEVCDPSESEDGLVVEEEPIVEAVDEPINNGTPVTDEDVKDDDAPKKSYASIVKVMKDGAATVPTLPPVSSKVIPKSQEQQVVVPLPAPAAPVTESQVSSSKVTENGNIQEVEADGHSIYLKGLPMNASYAQLDNEFNRFGAIKNGGIQIRYQKMQGFCFGFVEFEDRSSAQSAIEASPVTIGGRQVVIEPKKSTSRGNVRERFISGRGAGFRNDMGRGRGNYAGNRGYSRGEANNRGEFGNRIGGRGFQNRGDAYQRVDHVGGNNGRVNRDSGFDAANNIVAPSVSATA